MNKKIINTGKKIENEIVEQVLKYFLILIIVQKNLDIIM